VEVTFKHVTLTYPNGVEVLHDMDFVIPDGKLIALLGPSGGGKSTTLNLISGLLAATTGEIFFGEKNVTKLDALQRGVGMVFQNYALYPHMTVLDNIIFPMKMAKVDKDTRRKKALELAKLVRVDDQINKKPGALSGGQQQRVAIARALAKEPSILLLDEPLSNLDARLRVEMREEIRRIQKETGVTTIFVTHDQSEALHIADQIMVLDDGILQQYADAQELYDHPVNQFVASFIGEPALNVIPAQDIRAALVPVFGQQAQMIESVGIRAEAITTNPVTTPHLELPIEVQRTLAFGRERNSDVILANHKLVATGIEREAVLNQTISAYIQLNGVHAFDVNGNRVEPEGGDQQ